LSGFKNQEIIKVITDSGKNAKVPP